MFNFVQIKDTNPVSVIYPSPPCNANFSYKQARIWKKKKYFRLYPLQTRRQSVTRLTDRLLSGVSRRTHTLTGFVSFICTKLNIQIFYTNLNGNLNVFVQKCVQNVCKTICMFNFAQTFEQKHTNTVRVYELKTTPCSVWIISIKIIRQREVLKLLFWWRFFFFTMRATYWLIGLWQPP